MVEPETSKRVGTCSASLEKGKKRVGKMEKKRKEWERGEGEEKGRRGKHFHLFLIKALNFAGSRSICSKSL